MDLALQWLQHGSKGSKSVFIYPFLNDNSNELENGKDDDQRPKRLRP